MDSEPTIHTSSGSELEDRPRTMLLAHAESTIHLTTTTWHHHTEPRP